MPKTAPGFPRSRFVRESVATLSILTLLVSVIVFPELVKAKAENRRNSNKTSPAIKNKPPEPFVVGSRTANRDLSDSISTVFAMAAISIIGNFGGSTDTKSTSAKTDELAKPANNVSKNLEPAAIANARMPRPLPTSTPAVPFDFDKDGKADLGRWHDDNSYQIVKSSNASLLNFSIGSDTNVLAPGH